MKSSLLIVDDEIDFLEGLSLALMEDFQVHTAADGWNALTIINNPDTSISLILLDLDMPEMNGIELLQKIRAFNERMPVIVLTGRSSHRWAKSCADMGVQGYLDKPIDIEELICKIKRILKISDDELLKSIWKDDYESGLSSLSPVIRKALAYIRDNYHLELSREDIASYLGVSPQYLSSLFHKECRIHLKDYINMLKVCKCKECLQDFELKISEIGPSVGIPDANYLTRLFKKYTGETPQEFRKKLRST